MKSLITLAILTALPLVGSADASISTIESTNHSYQLIEHLPKAGFNNSFSGDVNITMTVNDAYAAVNLTSQMEEINYNQKFNIEG